MADSLVSSAVHLEAWYSALYSRYVDLVGDYAGRERFFIEGDSLLLQVFSTPQLDFEGTSLRHLRGFAIVRHNSSVAAGARRFALTGIERGQF